LYHRVSQPTDLESTRVAVDANFEFACVRTVRHCRTKATARPVYRAADFVLAQTKTALDALGNVGPADVATVGAALAAAWGITGWMPGSRHDAAERGAKRTV
jgi:hypothetical protein